MKIYILRHEDRTQDCSFYAPLTKEGLDNSKKLSKKIGEHKINKIYSSPFIRTLQTIYPYAMDSSMNICLEHALQEINHEDIISKKAANANLPQYIAESFRYNPEYNSFIKSEDIPYPEKINNVEKRVKRFLRNIIGETKDNESVLLVTHQCIGHCIFDIIRKARPDIKISDKETFNTGQLILVFDRDWTFKKI